MTPAVQPHRDEALPPAVALAFAPLHKRAFGMAIGLALGLLIFVATAVQLLRAPGEGVVLWLLSNYFAGYTVSWGGAFIGFAWGFVTGFVVGWFIAFCRNLVIAISLLVIRARSELSQTADFLDHI